MISYEQILGYRNYLQSAGCRQASKECKRDSKTGESKRKRTDLLKKLDLPERMSTKAMLDILNTFITYDEYKNLVESEEII